MGEKGEREIDTNAILVLSFFLSFCFSQISCFGGLLCLATMFMMDWIKALASLLLAFVFFALLIK